MHKCELTLRWPAKLPLWRRQGTWGHKAPYLKEILFIKIET